MSSHILDAFFNKSFLFVLILLLGSISLGVSIAFPSPTLKDITKDFNFTTGQSSFFNAITSLMAILGPHLTEPFLSRKGRKYTTCFVSIVCIVGWLIFLLISTDQKTLAILFRAVLGVAAGGYTAVIPLYIMEISPVECRSVFGSMHQVGINIGIFLTNFLGMYLHYYNLSLFMALIPAIQIVLLRFVPESPVFEASASSKYAIPQINANISKSESFCSRMYFEPLMLGVCMMGFQQFSGINAVLTNLGSILQMQTGPTLAASAQLFSCLCCMTAIDRLGRRKTWAFSLFGSAISMIVLAIDNKFKISSYLSTLSAFAFLFWFGFGLGPIPWFLQPELFPDSVRTNAISFLSSLNWLFSFTIILLYPQMIILFGDSNTFGLFAIILFIGGVYGLLKIRENRNPSQILHEQEVPSFSNVMYDI